MSINYYSIVRREVFSLIPRGGRLLDFGGGDGATAAALKAEGHADHIGVADLVAPAHQLALDFAYQGDLTDAAFTSRITAEVGLFDTILCLDILEHFIDPWTVVKRLDAMLKPGGALVASLPNIRYCSVLLPLVFKGQFRYCDEGILDRTHLRFFTREGALELLTSSGLMLEQVEANAQARRRDKWLNLISFNLFEGILAPQYFVRVRKSSSPQIG